jgi:protein-disulfide isomerase
MAKKKRQKLSKAQAKAEAQRRQRQRQMMWGVGGVIAVAVVAVIIVIVLQSGRRELVSAEPLRADIETGLTEEGYPYRGASDAPVTIVEFSDYNCPACGDYATSTAQQVDDELVATGQVKYVVQPYALWEESLPIVAAAACARDQGKFWDFHHQLFANQSLFSTRQPPSRALLNDFAEASGLNVGEFQACVDEGRHDAEVLASTQKGKVDMGVNSTPTFFVNGERVQLYSTEPYIVTLKNAVQAAQAAGSSNQ